jgi:heptosyltransferase-2
MKLLVRVPNWLGDIVMALPAIQAIRAHFAKASLTLAAPEGFAALCAMVPGVDDVLPLPRGSTWRTWRAQRDAIRAGEFHLAILLTNSWGSAWVMTRAGVPERWGYRTDMRGRLLTRAVERPRPESSRGRRGRHMKTGADSLARANAKHRVHAVMTTPHHSHYYLALTEALGMAPTTKFQPLPVSDEALARAQKLLQDRGWTPDSDRALVGIAPGAAYGHAKRWPADYIADVMIRLDGRGITTVLLGAAGDRDAARAIESALTARGADVPRISLVGETDLPTLMGVMASCEAILSNDSGAMHLASAVGRPVVALFGPTNEQATSPLGPHTIVHTDAWCRPCMLRECPIDHRCMRGLTPETVFDHVMTWMKRAPGAYPAAALDVAIELKRGPQPLVLTGAKSGLTSESKSSSKRGLTSGGRS